MEFTFIKMAQNMKETGKTIFSMVMGKKYGQMAQNMKAKFLKIEFTVKENIQIQTIMSLRGNLEKGNLEIKLTKRLEK